MIISNDFLIKTKIFLGKVYGFEKDEEVFIELKEPKGIEFMKLNQYVSNEQDGTKLFESIFHLLPSVVVSHNFYKDEKTLLTNQEVVDFLNTKLEAITEVINTYSNEVLFLLLKAKQEETLKK